MPDVSHSDAAPQECSMTLPQAHPRQSPKRRSGKESSVKSSLQKETAMPDVDHSDATPQEYSMTPPQAHPRQLPKRGNGHKPFKRRMWEKEEIHAVEKHMMSFIKTCRVPGKSDCEKCLELEKVALKGRNWLAITFYIKNRITALKNKV